MAERPSPRFLTGAGVVCIPLLETGRLMTRAQRCGTRGWRGDRRGSTGGMGPRVCDANSGSSVLLVEERKSLLNCFGRLLD